MAVIRELRKVLGRPPFLCQCKQTVQTSPKKKKRKENFEQNHCTLGFPTSKLDSASFEQSFVVRDNGQFLVKCGIKQENNVHFSANCVPI